MTVNIDVCEHRWAHNDDSNDDGHWYCLDCSWAVDEVKLGDECSVAVDYILHVEGCGICQLRMFGKILDEMIDNGK